MSQTGASRLQIEARIIERARREPEFKRRLLTEPRATLVAEMMEDYLPEGVTLQVMEETPTTRYLVLPAPRGGTRPPYPTEYGYYTLAYALEVSRQGELADGPPREDPSDAR